MAFTSTGQGAAAWIAPFSEGTDPQGNPTVAVNVRCLDGVDPGALTVVQVNGAVENIGARRLYTVMERVFEELSFTSPDRAGETVTVDADFVENNVGALARSADLSRYVL